MSEETVTFNLEINVEQTFSQVRRLELLLYRTIGLIRRLGLPENIEEAISKIQRLVMVIRLAHSAIIAFQVASGPIGWALAAVSIGTAAVTAGEFVMEVLP